MILEILEFLSFSSFFSSVLLFIYKVENKLVILSWNGLHKFPIGIFGKTQKLFVLKNGQVKLLPRLNTKLFYDSDFYLGTKSTNQETTSWLTIIKIYYGKTMRIFERCSLFLVLLVIHGRIQWWLWRWKTLFQVEKSNYWRKSNLKLEYVSVS